MPVSPDTVCGCAPIATANRVISWQPRDTNNAIVFIPKPNPSTIPAAHNILLEKYRTNSKELTSAHLRGVMF